MGCDFADNLPERIERVSDHALRTGALQPIAARSEEVEEQGVRFVIHLLDEQDPKQEHAARQGNGGESPFLPAG